MSFFTPSKADIQFVERELVWRIYTVAEVLPTTWRLEIIDKKKFVAAALKADVETFVVHIVALAKLTTIPIYPSRQAQVAILTSEETGIPAEYSDFSDIFFSDSVAELLEYTGINNHPVNLLDDKQPLYNSIYSPGLVELEILKTYIQANLASGFNRPSKSLSGALILFVRKKNGSLRLCVDY